MYYKLLLWVKLNILFTETMDKKIQIKINLQVDAKIYTKISLWKARIVISLHL